MEDFDWRLNDVSNRIDALRNQLQDTENDIKESQLTKTPKLSKFDQIKEPFPKFNSNKAQTTNSKNTSNCKKLSKKYDEAKLDKIGITYPYKKHTKDIPYALPVNPAITTVRHYSNPKLSNLPQKRGSHPGLHMNGKSLFVIDYIGTDPEDDSYSELFDESVDTNGSDSSKNEQELDSPSSEDSIIEVISNPPKRRRRSSLKSGDEIMIPDKLEFQIDSNAEVIDPLVIEAQNKSTQPSPIPIRAVPASPMNKGIYVSVINDISSSSDEEKVIFKKDNKNQKNENTPILKQTKSSSSFSIEEEEEQQETETIVVGEAVSDDDYNNELSGAQIDSSEPPPSDGLPPNDPADGGGAPSPRQSPKLDLNESDSINLNLLISGLEDNSSSLSGDDSDIQALLDISE